MFVGTAVSKLKDPQEKRLNFSAEEINSAEGRWYRNLTGVQDSVGSIEDLQSTKSKARAKSNGSNAKSINSRHNKPSDQQSTSKILAIEEIGDESESEDEDLVAYEKPDSDISDDDEDATLVQRDKPTAPV